MIRNRLYPNLLAVLVLLFSAQAVLAGEPGTVFVDTQLRSAPGFSGKKLSRVGRDSRVEILQRKGIWMQVSLADKPGTRGWLRRFDVRLDSKSTRSGSGGGSGAGLGKMLGGLFGGGRSEPGATSTIGIRGLDAADLQASRPNPAELKNLHSLSSSPRDAQVSARAAGLQAHQVEYLEEKQGSGTGNLLDW